MNKIEKKEAKRFEQNINRIIKLLSKQNNLLKNDLLDIEDEDVSPEEKSSKFGSLNMQHTNNEITMNYLTGIRDGMNLFLLDNVTRASFRKKIEGMLGPIEDGKRPDYVG